MRAGDGRREGEVCPGRGGAVKRRAERGVRGRRRGAAARAVAGWVAAAGVAVLDEGSIGARRGEGRPASARLGPEMRTTTAGLSLSSSARSGCMPGSVLHPLPLGRNPLTGRLAPAAQVDQLVSPRRHQAHGRPLARQPRLVDPRPLHLCRLPTRSAPPPLVPPRRAPSPRGRRPSPSPHLPPPSLTPSPPAHRSSRPSFSGTSRSPSRPRKTSATRPTPSTAPPP